MLVRKNKIKILIVQVDHLENKKELSFNPKVISIYVLVHMVYIMM